MQSIQIKMSRNFPFILVWRQFYEVIFSSPKIVSAKKKKNEITFIFGYNVG